LYFNSLTELFLYFSYVHVLRFVSRLLYHVWIGSNMDGWILHRMQDRAINGRPI